MAGMGLQGGTARCYDWFMDYLKVSFIVQTEQLRAFAQTILALQANPDWGPH